MKVSDFTWRQPVTIEVDETIAAAAQRFAEQGVGALVVVDHECVVGIVTDRDLVVRGLAHRVASDGRIDSLMSMRVITLDADEEVDELYSVFARNAIRRVPVVKHDRVVGMISIDDVMVATAAELTDLAGVLSTQIAFPFARDEPPHPAVVDA